MPLDPNIILNVGRGVTPVDDLGTIYDNQSKRLQRDEMVESARVKRHDQLLKNQEHEAMARAYRDSVGEDGNINDQLLLSNLARNGAGNAIPGVRKTMQEGRKISGEIDYRNAETRAKVQETLYKGLMLADNSIASLLANPNTTDRDVYSEMGRLVKLGAFDAQAQYTGKSPDVMAQTFLSTMPVGNPQALRAWLVQQGARAADATKRLELALPKYDEQDRGGVISQGTINQFTGERTAGAGPANNVTKTNTPDAVLKASTDMRVAGMVDQRQRETNDINREASQSQIVEGPNGFQVVNKATTLARPVSSASGQPVIGKDSPTAKNANMARGMLGQIKFGEDLLKSDPTGSKLGAVFDSAIGAVGLSTAGGDVAQKLETLGGWMTSNVPRLEGPQGQKDAELYANMAGNIGDRSIPIDRRLASLSAVKKLMERYDNMPGTQPARIVSPAPPAPGMGPTLAAPRQPIPYRGATPIGARPGALPDINMFFTNGGQ